jgi:1-acyl-sn-glycerol-3-phosphate acyltransferase
VIFLRSLVFNFFTYVGISVACILSLPTLLLPRKKFLSKISYLLGFYLIFLTKAILKTKIEFIGMEKMPKDKKFFIASAHQSMLETFLYNFLIPDCTFVIKKELLSIPLYGFYLKKLEYVSIDRGKTTKDNIDSFAQIFGKIQESNRTLIIFPQGTRVPPDEQPMLKKGASRIYQGLNISCVPVKLNTGSVWPRNSFYKYPGKIIFEFKDSIEPGMDRVAFTKELENKIYN